MRIGFGAGGKRKKPSGYTGGGALPPVTNGIIHDIDNDSDGGDILNTLVAINGGHHHRGLTKLLAFVVTSANDYAAPMVEAQLAFHGYTDVAVGAVVDTTGTPASFALRSQSVFTQSVRDQFNPTKSRTSYQTEVAVYKEALAKCADGTCKVIITGGFTSIARLLADAAGKALLAQKCAAIYCMGGHFTNAAFSEANIHTDQPAAAYFCANVPAGIPVIWAGYEAGNTILNYLPTDYGFTTSTDPNMRGINLFQGNYNPLPVWDHIATFYAHFGLGTDPVSGGALFGLSSPQDVTFDTNNYTVKSANPSGQHRYLSKVAADNIIQAVLQREVYEAYHRATASWVAQDAIEAGSGYRSLYQFYGKLDAGSGQTVADSSGYGRNGTLGQSASVASDDPTWIAQGLQFDGLNDLVSVPHSAGFNSRHLFMWAIVSISATGAVQIFSARDDGGSNRQFHFRVNASNQFEFIAFNGGAVTVTATSLTLSPGNWYLVSAEIFDQIVILRNGTTIVAAASTTITNGWVAISASTPLTLGVRGTATNPLNGKIAAYGLMRDPPADKINSVLADAAALAVTKGITLS
jgi:hypothetical protein